MAFWPVDKLLNSCHPAKGMEIFYCIGGLGQMLVYLVGGLEVILVVGFVLGIQKRLTYGLVFLLHAISTLSSYQQYLNPWESPNLLFFAAWPMLAACFALYALRDADTMGVIPRAIPSERSATSCTCFQRSAYPPLSPGGEGDAPSSTPSTISCRGNHDCFPNILALILKFP